MISTVDVRALEQLVWAAPLASLTVAIAWAMVVSGVTRAAEAHRDRNAALVALHASIGVAGAALFAAAVVFGLIIMTSKD
jgi:hypothetical protein